jgi:hypothetical protein
MSGKQEQKPGAIQRRRHRDVPRRRGGAPIGNTNALGRGIYANRFLSDEERALFKAILRQLYQAFAPGTPGDRMQAELVATDCLKLGRAQLAGDWDAAERLDRMLRCHLRWLKATRIAREGEPSKGRATTPAEWAAALLEKINGTAKGGSASTHPARKKPQKIPD